MKGEAGKKAPARPGFDRADGLFRGHWGTPSSSRPGSAANLHASYARCEHTTAEPHIFPSRCYG